jgi:hypothetical protein
MDDKWADDCIYAILQEEWMIRSTGVKNVKLISHNKLD